MDNFFLLNHNAQRVKPNKIIPIDLNKYLSKKQRNIVSTKPDVIWQFAQRLKKNIPKTDKIFLCMLIVT